MLDHDVPARLKLVGPVTDVSNNSPLTLSDGNTVYVVEAGELVVFAVEMGSGEPGQRRFTLTAGPGEAVFGVPQTSSLDMVGTGNVGTQVRSMPLTDLHATANGEAASMLTSWAAKLTAGVLRYDRTSDVPTLPDPVTATIVVAAPITDSAAYGAEALTRLRTHLEAIDVADAGRLIATVRREEQLTQDAVNSLAGVLNQGEAEVVATSSDPLLAACRTVAAQVGIAIVEPENDLVPSLKGALRQIAKSSQLRVRRVLLEDGWFPVEAGPLVATMKDDGRPVALAQSRSGGYEVIDHTRGERHPLDQEQASRLASEAYVFYPAWPAVTLTRRHVLAMGLRGTRKDILRIVMFGLASALLALVTPIATEQLFNQIIPTAARERLLVLVGALLLGAVAAAAFNIAQGLALIRLETRFNESLGTALWDRILRLPVPFFRLYSIGDLAQRTMAIDAIRQILAQAGFSVVLSAVFSLSSLVLLFVYDPSLAGIALLLLLVSTVVTGALTVKQVRRQRELLALRGDLSGLVIQQVVGVSKLRVTAAERRAFAEWSSLFARQQTAVYRANNLRNLQIVFNAGWIPFTTMVVFWWLSRRELDSIDPGTFLAFLAAFGQILVANRAITSALGGLLQTIPLYERARPILEAMPEVVQNAQDPGLLTGRVEVSHVDFRYAADGPLVLHDVSIEIKPGQFVAVVGPSGAGKSSLIRLLLGFERPEAGAVLFDGKDLATLDIELVRRQIGVVLQAAQLMPGSIFTNIVGETDLTRDDAWLAAAQAGLDGDLNAMPMGMDTLITEGSSTLSGGQKQRLLIARALAMHPHFLLFDEATSALDNITQRTVTQSLQQLAVTRIVIAHRLSTIAGADTIIVMDKGRVVESGSYAQLMANHGPFAELAARQIA